MLDHGGVGTAAPRVGAERQRLEDVAAAGPQPRPRRRLGLGDVHRPTQPSRRPACSWETDLGPHGAERAAQAGGELLPPLDDLRGGHAVGQVDLETPAGAVLADRATGSSADSPLRRAWLIPAMPSEPARG